MNTRIVEQIRFLGVPVRQKRIPDGHAIVMKTEQRSISLGGGDWSVEQHTYTYKVESGEELRTKKIVITDHTDETDGTTESWISEMMGYSGSYDHTTIKETRSSDKDTTIVLRRGNRNLILRGSTFFGRILRLKGVR